MVGVHQAAVARDDAVAVVVGVVAKGDVEAVLELDQPGHGLGRGAVHADLAVAIDAHEAKRRVDALAHQRHVEAVALGDGAPEVDAGTAHGIDADLQARVADGGHVDHVRQVLDIGRDVVVKARRARGHGAGEVDPFHAVEVPFEQLVGAILDDARHLRVGRATVRRVVFEAAVVRWVVRGRDDDAVRQMLSPPAVVGEDGVRDDRRGRVAKPHLNAQLDAIGRQDLDRCRERRFRERVRVHADEERPVDLLRGAVVGHGLGDGQDVPLVKALPGRDAAMPRRAKGDALLSQARVWSAGEVGGDEARDVALQRFRDRLSGEGMAHGVWLLVG